MKRYGLKKSVNIFTIVILFIILTAWLWHINFFKTSPINKTDDGIELKELSTNEKLEDLNYMYDLLKDNHPYFETEERKTGYNWLNHKSDFEEWIKNTKNNKEFYDTISRILKLIQNGHTNIITPDLYDEYRQVYNSELKSSKVWADVLNNKAVVEKYKGWANIIDRKTYVLPVTFSYIEGNYIVSGSADENRVYIEKYGIPQYSILKKVNDDSIDDYIKKIMDKKILNYDYKREKLKINNLIINCDEGKILKLTFETPDGNVIEREISGVEYTAPAGSMKNPSGAYSTVSDINGGKAAYLKVSSFSAFNVESDRDGIYKFLANVKDYPYLIIDIRGNGGGSENYWMENIVEPLLSETKAFNSYLLFKGGKYIEPFIKSRLGGTEPMSLFPDDLNNSGELKSSFKSFFKSTRSYKPSNSIGFKGKIYLLVDDYVFSSAEAFAAFAKATGWATIVGTWTGGDGIGMDPALFSLPNSGLVIRFPLEMGLNPDGTSNEEYHTAPDVYAEQSYADFIKYQQYKQENNSIINPYDTVLNKVLELMKQ